MPTVAAVHIYPVKALRGLDLEATEVEPWGFADDRRFLVARPDGRFLTQRELPFLATIEAERSGPALILRAAGHPALTCEPGAASPCVDVTVWRDRVPARPVGPAADTWLEAVLGRPCRLFYMDDPARARPVDPAFSEANDRVTFADGFPVLLTSATSLADLNSRLPEPIGMDRFRPNLVVEGLPAWAEDGWRRLRVGGAVFDIVKPCARCVVTTTDQRTGQRDEAVEPIRTLQTFRRDTGGQVLFGQNLIPRRCGRVAVGDMVEILA